MTAGCLSIGCCASADELAVLEATPGLDYIELPVARALMGGRSEFDELAGRLRRSPLGARAANVLLPAGLKVVGPDAQTGQLSEFATTALQRAAALGVRVLVFGSGASRAVPEGFPRDRALVQLATAIRLVHAEARTRGVTLALEPLHSEETNLLNSLAEAASFLRQRQLDGVRLVADLWHMECEGEELDVLDEVAGLLAHAHVAAANRHAPGRVEDHIEPFLRRLHQSGYAGACSIECWWSDLAVEAPMAVQRVREAAVAAGWPSG